ncbi:MAG: copper amine oxidase N-terminal domain-containing protein [Bacillota bacterium]|nr:copper amine oxidase N-terminal domain-containing protein [Bacillota bacterium]
MKKRFRLMMIMAVSVAVFALGSICAFAQDEYDPSVNDYNVMLNGEYVQFSDAAPVNVSGRIMVPFRAILETLGAEVSWNDASRTVTAVSDDTTIKFVVGQPDINIVKDGKTFVKKMDVVPYINTANNRTYVSTRFVAESLGYTVGWDSDRATAVIIDYDRIFGNAEKDFSKIDEFMMKNRTDVNTAYETLMEMAVNVTVYKEFINSMAGENVFSKDLSLDVTADASAITKGSEMSMDMDMKMNIAELLLSLPADAVGDISAEDMELIKKLSNMEMSAYADMESGDMYFTTNVNSALDPSYGDSTWFKLNLYSVYETLGLDLKELMQASVSGEAYTVAQVLNLIAEASESEMTIYTYDEMSTVYEAMEALIGDSALKVTKSGSNTEYTADFSKLSVLTGDDSVKGEMVITEKNDGTYDCSFSFSVEEPGMMKISMSMDSTYDKTTKAVEKAPAGAQIVDMTSMFESAIQ